MAEESSHGSRDPGKRRPAAGSHTLFPSAPQQAPRWTSGRECWVFRADSPEQLCGHHPNLIRCTGLAEEAFEYLLYSPLCEGMDGPFHVAAGAGSHAVGITRTQIVVSRDPHADGLRRSVTRVPLEDVTHLEIGCALLAGWLVIHVRGSEGAESHVVPFRSQGMRHFRAVVRAFRVGSLRPGPNPGPEREWTEVWAGVPAYLRSELEPLLEEGERPLAILRSPERWTGERRLWRSRSRCDSAPGLLVATRGGLLWAASEPRTRPEGLAFGVNVTVARAERVAWAAIGEAGGLGVLRLQVGPGPSAHELEVRFEGQDVVAAEDFVQLVHHWSDRP